MTIELQHPEAIKQEEKPGSIVFTDITPTAPFEIQTTKIDIYRKDARKILDVWSIEFNKVGINAMIAALIIEARGFGNYGSNNP
jgi:hypothetical protein